MRSVLTLFFETPRPSAATHSASATQRDLCSIDYRIRHPCSSRPPCNQTEWSRNRLEGRAEPVRGQGSRARGAHFLRLPCGRTKRDPAGCAISLVTTLPRRIVSSGRGRAEQIYWLNDHCYMVSDSPSLFEPDFLKNARVSRLGCR